MANNPYPDLDADSNARPLDPVEPPAPIDGDRGEPQTKAPKRKNKFVVLAIVAVVVFALMFLGFAGLFFYNNLKAKEEDGKNVKEDAALATKADSGPDLGRYQDKLRKDLEDQRLADAAAMEEARQAALRAQQQSEHNGQQNAAPQGQGQGRPAPDLGRYNGGQGTTTRQASNGEKPEPTPREKAAMRRLEGDVLWAGEGGQSMRTSSAGTGGASSGNSAYVGMSTEDRVANNPYLADAMGNGGGSGGSGGSLGLGGGSSGGQSNSIGGMLQTEDYPNGAVMQRRSVKFLLSRGTTIPCTIRERIVTNYPGGVMCIINRDVYSADGSVLLMRQGSTVNGERKVAITAGVAKVFIAWRDVETTDKQTVRFDSLAADSLGGAGVDAWLDRHLMERFGGALLLSAADDVFKAIGNSTSNSDVSFDSSTNNAQDMASIALENSINIPNTGYVKQAAETNILVARDVDFTSVFGVE
ncbi:TrbI/VirB10 family protein (plasmid) [Pseudomonas alloputida]|uniref:TrbI/VirB10 family protein n=1 Tax=Pseudomonas alloputida TaxID=1940621 RepID=UPI003B42DC7D